MHTAAQCGQQEFVRQMLVKVPATITTEQPRPDTNNPLLSVNTEVRPATSEGGRLKIQEQNSLIPFSIKSAGLETAGLKKAVQTNARDGNCGTGMCRKRALSSQMALLVELTNVISPEVVSFKSGSNLLVHLACAHIVQCRNCFP